MGSKSTLSIILTNSSTPTMSHKILQTIPTIWKQKNNKIN